MRLYGPVLRDGETHLLGLLEQPKLPSEGLYPGGKVGEGRVRASELRSLPSAARGMLLERKGKRTTWAAESLPQRTVLEHVSAQAELW